MRSVGVGRIVTLEASNMWCMAWGLRFITLGLGLLSGGVERVQFWVHDFRTRVVGLWGYSVACAASRP